jgi:hypothetical protein
MSIKHLTFDDSATIAFGAITNSYANLLALSDDADLLFIFNTTDVPISLSIPSGYNASKNIRFPAAASMAIDCRTNSKRIAKGTIQVKYISAAPTLGEVTITAVR